LILGVPAFFIGCILVFVSMRSIKTKLLTTIVPLVLYIPFTYAFLYLYNYSTPKTILIPENFQGNLRIIYEEKCGSNYMEQNGVKTLVFPDNGILVLNEDFNRHINYKYYLVDKLGNKTEIQQVFNVKESTENQPYILVGGSGMIGQAIVANTTIQEEQKDIQFSDFYVYNKDSIVISDFKSQEVFDSLTTQIVKQCRLLDKGSR
jgi:hypothetical protein